jgi:hypothetical protein
VSDDADRIDPRTRPDDPAGTKPKVDSASLVPAVREPLVGPPPPPEEPPSDFLPAVPDPAEQPVPAAAAAAEPPHAPRFQFLLGALFALGLAAIAAIALLAIEGAPEKDPPEPAWSTWKPTAAETAPAEIADYVAPRYTHEGGRQLVNVTGGPLQFGGLPAQLIYDSGLNYAPIGGSAVLYNLCGIGSKEKDCRIAYGKPSVARGMLLEREIVELALYTFRYTKADNVIATLPVTADPKTKKFADEQDSAVVIQRTDVEGALKRPLSATLTEETPSLETVKDSPESVFIGQLLRGRRFDYRLQSGGIDGAYLVLRAPSA